jgi:hypothetical protein
MRKTTKTISAAFAMTAMTTQAFAGGVCSRAAEANAVKAEILQQQLMVAAYSCHMAGAYNAFVINYRPDLIASDHAAESLFVRASAGGAEDYQSYKTHLANGFSSDSSQDTDGFCENAQDMFRQAAEHRGQSLNDLMAALNFDGDAPFAECRVHEAALPERQMAAAQADSDSDYDDGEVEGGSSGAMSHARR